MKKNNIFICTVLGLVGLWIIFSLRNTNYPEAITSICGFIFDYAAQITDSVSIIDISSEGFKTLLKSIHFLIIAIPFLLGLIAITALKYKTADTASGIYLNICLVIKTGLSFVLFTFILIIMFLSSVVGTAVAFLLAAATMIMTVLGLIPFSLALGSYLQKLYNGNSRSIFSNFILGFLFTAICCNIYGFSGPMTIFVLPVVGTGSFLFSIHCMLSHNHFDTSITGIVKEGFDRSSIRNIITKDIN